MACVGSLPRPDDRMALYAANAPDEKLQSRLRAAVGDPVAAACGFFPEFGPVLINCDCSAIAGCRKRQVGFVPDASGGLLPSPLAEKTTTR